VGSHGAVEQAHRIQLVRTRRLMTADALQLPAERRDVMSTMR